MILVAELYLAEDEKDETIEQKCSSQDAAVSLRGWVAKAILPTDPFAEASPYSTRWFLSARECLKDSFSKSSQKRDQ